MTYPGAPGSPSYRGVPVQLMRGSQDLITWSLERHHELSHALYEWSDSLNPKVLRTGLDDFPKKSRHYAKKVLRSSFSVSILLQNSMIDHGRAARTLLSGDQVVLLSPLSLARVVVECAARSCNLLDSGASLRELVLRAAAAEMEGLQSQRKLSAHFDQAVQQCIDGEIDRVKTRLLRAGIAVDSNGVTLTNVRWVDTGDRASCRINVTELAKKWIGDIPAIYGMSSGAVHGGVWLAAGSLAPDASALRADPEMIVLAAIAIAMSFRAVVLEGYRIQDKSAGDYEKESHQKIQGLIGLLNAWKRHMASVAVAGP